MKKQTILKRIAASTLAAVMIFSSVFGNVSMNVRAEGETVKVERSEIATISAKTHVEDLNNLYDGSTSTYVDSKYWEYETNATSPQWYLFELTESAKISQVRIHPRTDSTNGRPTGYTIYAGVSEDALTEVTSGTIDLDHVDWTSIPFTATEAKYVKVELTSSTFEAVHVITAAEVELWKENTTVTEPADTFLLESLVDYVHGEMEKEYYPTVIPKVREKLEASLRSAEALLERGDATQEEVDAAFDELFEIKNMLSYIQGDLTELKALVEEVKAIDLSKYTEESAAKLKEALAEAEDTISLGENAVVDFINNSMNSLTAAKDALVEINAESFRGQVEKKLEYVKNTYVRGEYNFYVDQIYEDRLPRIEKILADPNADVTALKSADNHADDIIKMLDEKNKITGLDKKIYDMIRQMEKEDPSDYTEDTWKNFWEKASTARGVVNNPNSSDERTKEVWDALEKAYNELVKVDRFLGELGRLAAEKALVENEDYTRESWIAFQNALYNVQAKLRESKATIDQETYAELKGNLEKTFAELTKGTRGTEYGRDDVWNSKETSYSIKGGQLYVEKEVQNGDGTTTLTVKWVNDGLDPETRGLMHNIDSNGKPMFQKPEWGKRTFDASTWAEVECMQIEVFTEDGNHEYYYYTSEGKAESFFNDGAYPESMREGFTQEIVVPTGSSVFLTLKTVDHKRWSAETFSVGTYYTKEAVAPDETAPEITVKKEYDEKTNKVTVTLTSNEPIETPEGWTKVNDQTFTKVYDKNGDYSVVAKDAAGNETKASFKVTEIKAKEDPKPEDKPNQGDKPNSEDKPNGGSGSGDGKKTESANQPVATVQAASQSSPKTGDSAQIGLIVTIMAAAGAAALFFRRKTTK